MRLPFRIFREEVGAQENRDVLVSSGPGAPARLADRHRDRCIFGQRRISLEPPLARSTVSTVERIATPVARLRYGDQRQLGWVPQFRGCATLFHQPAVHPFLSGA